MCINICIYTVKYTEKNTENCLYYIQVYYDERRYSWGLYLVYIRTEWMEML